MENNNFVIENGVLKSYVGSDTCVSIPEGVTKVGKKAFSGKNKIKEVIFPQNSLKSIEAGAFASCKSIKNLMLPKGLLQIGDNAFTDCAALEYVFIPDSVALIGEDLFGSNHSVIILGETGSEAEKYANANSPKLPFSTNVSAISAAKKAPERKTETKIFDVFGEDVKCSSTLSFFHNALEYYEYRKDVLFERVIDALPLEINADFSKILNVQNFLNQEDLLLIERIEKYGFIISKGEIAVHTAETSISMIEATKAIAEFYCQAIKYQQSTIQDQAAQLQQAAENSVTGLSYGILGNSFDMAIYALDDFRARQKQRREAYAKVEARLASFKEKLTTNIQREYVKTVSDKIPVIRQLTDNYITGLRNAEIVKLVDVGVLDRKAVDAIDLEKSSELLQKALDAKNDDKAFLIAKALEKYPCNCAAIAYAVEQGLTCDGLEQLIDFVGLQEKVSQTIASNAANRHAERYEKAAASLSSAAYQNRINALMNEEKVFSKEEIRNLLQIPIPAISSKLISATENPDISQEYTPEQYAKSKLYAILPEAQWDFYKKYSIIPFNNKKIPATDINTYGDLLNWFQSKIQAKEDAYIRACKMLESGKSLFEAKEIFHDLADYKKNKDKYNAVKNQLKKKTKKSTIILLSIMAVIVVAICSITSIVGNAPYRNLEKAIDSGAFDAKWIQQNQFEHKISSENSLKIIAKKLTFYHNNEMPQEALDLLYILFESGYKMEESYLCASSSFVNWICDTAITAGTGSTIQGRRYIPDICQYQLCNYQLQWSPNMWNPIYVQIYVASQNEYYDITNNGNQHLDQNKKIIIN